jgi:hypothetical protein
MKLSSTTWIVIIIVAAFVVLSRIVGPEGFSGLQSQRGIYGTGTGLYNGQGVNKVAATDFNYS